MHKLKAVRVATLTAAPLLKDHFYSLSFLRVY